MLRASVSGWHARLGAQVEACTNVFRCAGACEGCHQSGVNGSWPIRPSRDECGRLFFGEMGLGGDLDICRNSATGAIAACASSLRYKSDIATFTGGLDVVTRLRPISFTWNTSGQRDLGFGAEEVFQLEPLLTTRDPAGAVDGVRCKQRSVVFVNAFKEQQRQIGQQRALLEQQRREIDALTRLVCLDHPDAAVCR